MEAYKTMVSLMKNPSHYYSMIYQKTLFTYQKGFFTQKHKVFTSLSSICIFKSNNAWWHLSKVPKEFKLYSRTPLPGLDYILATPFYKSFEGTGVVSSAGAVASIGQVLAFVYIIPLITLMNTTIQRSINKIIVIHAVFN